MDSESPLLLNDDAELWTVSTTLWFLLKYTTITLLLFFTVRYFYRRYTMNKKLTLYPRTLTDNESSQLATLKEKIDLLSREQLEESGNLFYDSKQYAMAIEVFTLAVEKGPARNEAVPVLLRRSFCYSKIGEYRNAYEDAEQCCHLRPDFAEALQRKDDTARLLQFDDEDEESENSSIYYPSILTDVELNQLAEIKEKLDSFSQQALDDTARQYSEHRQFAMAIEVFTLALDKDAFCDAAAHLLQHRSFCNTCVGNDKAAYEDAGLACGINPKIPPLFERRGDTARAVGEFEIAIESFDEALKLSEDFFAVEKVDRSEMRLEYNAQIVEKKEKVLALVRRKKLASEALDRYYDTVSNFEDPHLRFEKACSMFLSGVLKGDLNRVKIGVKLGARLDAPLAMRDLKSLMKRDKRTVDEESRRMFSHQKIELNRSQLTNHKAQILTLASICTMQMSSHQRGPLENPCNSWQLEFLNYVLDLSDAQAFQMPFCLARYALLPQACLSDFGPLLTNTPMYRKEVLRLIMKRFQSAKRFFLDSRATDKDFATALFLTVLKSDPEPAEWNSNNLHVWNTQELYGLLSSLLKLGVDPNANWIYPVDECKALLTRKDVSSVYSHSLPIITVVSIIDSPQIVQLLLDFGADPNSAHDDVVDRVGTKETMTVLDGAMRTMFEKTDCFRLISSHGGRFTTKPTPAWILRECPPSKWAPFVQNEQTEYMLGVLVRDEPNLKLLEEWIVTVFNQMIKQGCSFLVFDEDRRAVFTPITIMLHPMKAIQVEKTEMILKWNAKLMDIPSFVVTNVQTFSVTALGCALFILHTADPRDEVRIQELFALVRLFLDYGASRFGPHWFEERDPRNKCHLTIDQLLDPGRRYIPWENTKRERVRRFFAQYDSEMTRNKRAKNPAARRKR